MVRINPHSKFSFPFQVLYKKKKNRVSPLLEARPDKWDYLSENIQNYLSKDKFYVCFIHRSSVLCPSILGLYPSRKWMRKIGNFNK